MPAEQRTANGRPGWQGLARLLAVVPASGAVSLIATLPGFALPTAVAGACYAVLLWWQPLAWLWVLPAVTVLLDLTSWTGRPLVNEYDALFLLTFAVSLARGEFHGVAGLRLTSFLPVAALLVLLLWNVPDWRLFLFPVVDNTSNPYYSPDYAHKLVKGAVWGLVLALLWCAQQQRQPRRSRTALLAGSCSAACLLGLVVLWERGSLYVLLSGSAWYHVVNSVLDLAWSYRVTGLFSDMHTGGEVMDGLIVLLLPLALHALLTGRALPLRLLGALALGSLLYCALVGFTRATYAAAGAVVLLYALCYALWHRSTLLARPGAALRAVLAIVLALFAGTVSFELAGSYGLLVCGGLQLLAYLGWQVGQVRAIWGALLLITVGALLQLAGLLAHLDSRWVTPTPATISALLVVWSASLAASRWAVPAVARLSLFDRGLVLLALMAAPGMLGLVAGGSQMNSRMENIERDLETRAGHWSRVIASGGRGLFTGLVGNGVGSFPRNYVAAYPESVRQVGSYAVLSGPGGRYLALGGGHDLAISQRVAVTPDTRYQVSLDIRTDDEVRLIASLCERNVLFASNFMPRCVSGTARAGPTRGEAVALEIPLPGGRVGEGGLLSRWPTALSLKNTSGGTVVDIHRVALVGGEKAALRNGGFDAGMDHWFFYNDFAHLPWHIKNTWLQVWYDTGALGSGLLLILLGLAFRAAFRAPWDDPLPALGMALAGLALLGLFGTPLDSPRVGWLFYFFLFVLVLRPRPAALPG